MSQDWKTTQQAIAARYRLANSFYARLGVAPSASAIEIRRAYRELSKRYHPDTTSLPADIATEKFQQLNEAYATLSNPERRATYDLQIGYSRLSVIQAPSGLNRPTPRSSPRPYYSSSAYLDPRDRPLSSGEIFALFIMGLTFLFCLLLAIAIGVTRGEAAFEPVGISGSSSISTTPAPEPASSIPSPTHSRAPQIEPQP